MRLTQELRDQIVAAARAALPNEAVGLLVGMAQPERYIAMVNAAGSPYRYSIDPGEQLAAWTDLESRGESVWAIVHSHVASPAEPSRTDIELAYFPESLYVIVSLANPDLPVIRVWSILEGSVTEVPLDIVFGPVNLELEVRSLAGTVPSFNEDEWWDSSVIGLDYPMLANLVTYLIHRVEQGDLSELAPFFAEVERLLAKSETHDLVHIEVIEGMHGLRQVLPFLGPRSRQCWSEVDGPPGIAGFQGTS